MATATPSLLSLSAAGLYLLVMAVCLGAAMVASRHRQSPNHARTWLVIGLAFALLAAMRITGLEEIVRDLFRDVLRVEGTYADRRSIQRPLAVAVIFGVMGLAAWVLYRQSRRARGRRDLALLAAVASVILMLLLLGLRIVSLHQLDRLLYGPLKLNWVTDIGASLLTMGAAAVYMRLVTRRP